MLNKQAGISAPYDVPHSIPVGFKVYSTSTREPPGLPKEQDQKLDLPPSKQPLQPTLPARSGPRVAQTIMPPPYVGASAHQYTKPTWAPVQKPSPLPALILSPAQTESGAIEQPQAEKNPQNSSPTNRGQIVPGQITYTTTIGPDGKTIYHPFKYVLHFTIFCASDLISSYRAVPAR